MPTSTYRVQFGGGFTFEHARARLAYLHRLGIGALYASPYLRARPDSTHGYDVSDHSALNPALGEEADYDRLAAELRRLGMGQILDIVPNHMGIGEPSNVWWMDVLENGPSSMYADYFDVDWSGLKEELRDRILLPILGDQYGRVLERGELRLAFEDGAFYLHYFETKLPISPRAYHRILRPALERLGDRVRPDGESDEHVMELESIVTAVRNLPPHHERAPELRRERHREAQVIKRRLRDLVAADVTIRAAIEAAVAELNGRPGDRHSFDPLDALLGVQSYRLAYWRVASEEINYRRFFDINDLAAIRMENPEVFEATHRLVLRMLEQGSVTGLRVDHPDGLWEPAAYFQQLRWAHVGPFLLVVEKILTGEESLPSSWPVDGTIGYEFLNALNGLFVQRSNRRRFDQLYARFVGHAIDWTELEYESKKLIMQVSLASEVNVLAWQLSRIAERNRRYRDFPLYSLRHAIREIIACFPVYRTYVSELTREISARDRRYIELAVARARRRNPAWDPSIFSFLRDILLLRLAEPGDDAALAEHRRFVMKFQQCTGPVAAKGVEDTAFYVYTRLTSLNEVGGDPDRFGVDPADFHHFNRERQARWRGGFSTTSTHDTKCSEDVRTRLDVLSEMPGEWAAALTRWSRLNRRKRRQVDGRPAPDRNEEYLLYQTLLGAWPLEPIEGDRTAFAERIVAHMAKATKEAKANTSWINPNEGWDAAVAGFVEGVLADEHFIADLLPLQRQIAHYGMYNSLSQTLLKLASPGVPDIYQGQELWDFSLVDPDNRRPVDYALRERMLNELERAAQQIGPAALASQRLEAWQDGGIKLWLTHRALMLRRERRALFLEGAYHPIFAEGARRRNVVAFARVHGDECVIACAARLFVQLTPDLTRPPVGIETWGEDVLALPSEVPSGRYRDVLTGEEIVAEGSPAAVPLAECFRHLPFGLLSRVNA